MKRIFCAALAACALASAQTFANKPVTNQTPVVAVGALVPEIVGPTPTGACDHPAKVLNPATGAESVCIGNTWQPITSSSSAGSGGAGFVSVQAYGALGNGTHDDSAAFALAFAASPNVFMPSGTYYLLHKIALPSNATLIGAGTSSIVSFDGSFADGQVITNAGLAGAFNNANITLQNFAVYSPTSVVLGGTNPGVIRFERVTGLTIYGISTTATGFQNTTSLIDFAGGVRNATVSGCNISNNNPGLGSGGALWIRGGTGIDTTYNSYNITVTGNVFQAQADEATGVYGWFNNINNVTFSDNVLINATAGSELGLGITGRNVGGQPGTVTNIAATGNVITGRINITTGADHINISGNIVGGATATNISSILVTEYSSGQGMPTNVTIANNTVSGSPGANAYGVYVGASGIASVIGNRFINLPDVAVYGDADVIDNTITYSGTTQFAIQNATRVWGNHISGGAYGIFMFGTNNLSWQNNIIENVATAGIAVNLGGGTLTGMAIDGNVIRNASSTMAYGIEAYNGTATNSFARHNTVTGAGTAAYSIAGFNESDNVQGTSTTMVPRMSTSYVAVSQAIATSGTITPNVTSQDWDTVPVTAASAATAVVLQAGTFNGELITLVNTGANSITFAASGTSHVADGTSDVIATLHAATYKYLTATSLWYRVYNN
jgi:Pectate lyase superfamily protein/Right handed beta helix region